MVKRQANGAIEYNHHPEISAYEISVIHVAIMQYGFLLNRPEYHNVSITFDKFADLIEQQYRSPQQAEICRVLRLAE